MWYVYTQNLRTDYYYNTYFDMIFLWYSPINCCSHGGLSNPLDILEILLDRVWRMVLPLSQQGNDWVCNDTTPVGHNERLLLANWWYRKKLHFLKWQQRILECPDFLRFRRAKYGSDALEASRKVLLTWWTCGQGLKLLENPALWPGVCVCVWTFSKEVKLVSFTLLTSPSIQWERPDGWEQSNLTMPNGLMKARRCWRNHTVVAESCENRKAKESSSQGILYWSYLPLRKELPFHGHTHYIMSTFPKPFY